MGYPRSFDNESGRAQTVATDAKKATHTPQLPDTTLLLRVEEVAQRLSLGRSKIFMLIAEGSLPVVRIGRAVRIPERALREWVEQRIESGDSRSWAR